MNNILIFFKTLNCYKMYLLKRIFNIIQSDINALLDKIERSQAAHKHDSRDRHYEWDNFKSDYNNKSSGSDSTNYNNIKYNNDRLAQYYANLEVPYGADIDTVKKAWKRLLKKCHPDLYANDPAKKETADNLTSRLNEAYREIEISLSK